MVHAHKLAGDGKSAAEHSRKMLGRKEQSGGVREGRRRGRLLLETVDCINKSLHTLSQKNKLGDESSLWCIPTMLQQKSSFAERNRKLSNCPLIQIILNKIIAVQKVQMK